MIVIKGTQVRVLNGDELLYSTYDYKEVHQISDLLYIIEEEKALTMVYCSTLILRLSDLVYYKIIPQIGVFIYEEIMNKTLGVFYNKNMERFAWFTQEEDYLVFMPQGRFNLLTRSYILRGFDQNGDFIVEDKRGVLGVWTASSRKYKQMQDAVIVCKLDDIN